MFNRKPVYFPEMRWNYMTTRWELQAKVYPFVLSNFQFSFQGFTQKRLPRYAYIVKVRLNKRITEQSSEPILSILQYCAVFVSNLSTISLVLVGFSFKRKKLFLLYHTQNKLITYCL